jgi:hypothetical protein
MLFFSFIIATLRPNAPTINIDPPIISTVVKFEITDCEGFNEAVNILIRRNKNPNKNNKTKKTIILLFDGFILRSKSL